MDFKEILLVCFIFTLFIALLFAIGSCAVIACIYVDHTIISNWRIPIFCGIGLILVFLVAVTTIGCLEWADNWIDNI